MAGNIMTWNAGVEDLRRLEDATRNYAAWIDAWRPGYAITTWPRITLTATSTSGPHGQVKRRPRANAISALKRRIERETGYTLTLESRRYSETHGFLHQSEFIYAITRP